jgi:hypothetical protein
VPEGLPIPTVRRTVAQSQSSVVARVSRAKWCAGPLLKAGGDAAVLFQAAHQPLDSIPLAIVRGIEAVPTVQGR